MIPGLPARRPSPDPIDPGLAARARRVLKARAVRDKWARYDRDAEDARDEAAQIRKGGNR